MSRKPSPNSARLIVLNDEPARRLRLPTVAVRRVMFMPKLNHVGLDKAQTVYVERRVALGVIDLPRFKSCINRA